jgi:hypothetical protein
MHLGLDTFRRAVDCLLHPAETRNADNYAEIQQLEDSPSNLSKNSDSKAARQQGAERTNQQVRRETPEQEPQFHACANKLPVRVHIAYFHDTGPDGPKVRMLAASRAPMRPPPPCLYPGGQNA